MQREKAAGVSFREGVMEVAFEQQTQRTDFCLSEPNGQMP